MMLDTTLRECVLECLGERVEFRQLIKTLSCEGDQPRNAGCLANSSHFGSDRCKFAILKGLVEM
jgi:hypothetical protein